MLIVLVLLSVMVLGGLALARMTEVGTLIAGNTAFKESAVQASEVGVNTAYARVQALATEEADAGNWYFARMLDQTGDGLPDDLDWDATPELTAGAFSVRYVVERMCDTLPVADPQQQCLLKRDESIKSSKAGAEEYDPPSGKQFRITVRVIGPKNTRTFVQALVTRG